MNISFMRRIVLALCFMVPVYAAGESVSFYDYWNDILLKADPEKQKQKKPESENVPLFVSQINPDEVAIKKIKDIDQRLIFVQMLKKEHPNKSFGDVLDQVGIEALELINRGEKFAALSRNFGVKTLFGEVMLTPLLVCPLVDGNAIKARQNTIRSFGSSEPSMACLREALGNIHDGQELLLTFFDEHSALEDRLVNGFYGTFCGWFGKNHFTIAVDRSLNRIYRAASFITPLIGFLSMADGLENVNKLTRWAFGNSDISTEEVKERVKKFIIASFLGGWSIDAIKRAPQTLIDMHNPYKMIDGTEKTKLSKAGWMAFGVGKVVAYDAFIVFLYNELIKEEKVANAVFGNMQKRLMGVAQVIKGLKRINDVLCSDLHNYLSPELAEIKKLFDGSASSGVKKLIDILQTSTFEGEISYFSNGVRILHAYNLMCEHKHELVPALEAVGVLDTFVAAADLIAHGPAGAYCYVDILDDQLPSIILKNFWNPLLAFDQAVKNSANLWAHADPNMVLTGPNGSGKSTNMKAIVLNVLLAQTFGIAAAESAAITPFNKIYTYINVQENIQEGMSTFMAEAQRLEAIDKAITSMDAGSRCLSIVDEGMRGTVAAEGVARLCNVFKRICQVPQSICIFATHFQEPTELQEQTQGRWINYYVEIDEPTPGTFVRLFTLKRGLNNWWFEDQQKRKRFVDWLVKTTQRKL